ncbi:MAG: AsnC family transcriptional regulator [Solirubrobacterales bacterium]
MRALDDHDRRLLSEFQQDFPLVARPYAAIAERLGLGEGEVIGRLGALKAEGFVSRVGAVFTPHRVGHSTLAAMAVPPAWLERIAAIVSAYPEVNHNYQRDHRLNLWFVVTAASCDEVHAVLADIANRTGIEVLDLPLVEDFHIDLGFDIRWS